MSPAGVRAEAVVDLGAVRANTGALLGAAQAVNPAAGLMAVVKADGYGHGAAEVARAALAGGATMLGLALPEEAVGLVRAGVVAPMLAWLWVPGTDLGPALAAGVQLVVSSPAQLAAVRVAEGQPRVHLKVDTGLGRNGSAAADFPDLVRMAAVAHRHGDVEIVGLMSHLANADVRQDVSVGEQIAAFVEAEKIVEAEGLGRLVRHLSNTPGVLLYPEAVFDLVRCGIGLCGVSPLDIPGPVPLRPAMTLQARVSLVKRVPAGHGVSYGLTYRTTQPTTLALVPLGYADGIPRSASNRAQVWCNGKRRTIAGRVAMDQFVLDCGDDPIAAGDEVLVFGSGEAGEPTANEFAAACGTIGYEIVTRIGPRVPRRYVGRPAEGPS